MATPDEPLSLQALIDKAGADAFEEACRVARAEKATKLREAGWTS